MILSLFGIDAMIYTKVVHDGLRGANILNPAMDAALRELDDFNKRAQAETRKERNAPVSES